MSDSAIKMTLDRRAEAGQRTEFSICPCHFNVPWISLHPCHVGCGLLLLLTCSNATFRFTNSSGDAVHVTICGRIPPGGRVDVMVSTVSPEDFSRRADGAPATPRPPGGAMSSTFLTSTAAEEADQNAQAVRTLEQELDLLRGVGGLGVPALDHEVEVANTARGNGPSYDSPQLLRSSSAPQLSHESELPSAVDELDSAQLRLVEELERQRMQRDQEGRAGLQEALRRQEGEAREQREALLGYLDELRRRDDEAGSEIRGDGFGRRVEELAAEEHSRRRSRGDIGDIGET